MSRRKISRWWSSFSLPTLPLRSLIVEISCLPHLLPWWMRRAFLHRCPLRRLRGSLQRGWCGVYCNQKITPRHLLIVAFFIRQRLFSEKTDSGTNAFFCVLYRVDVLFFSFLNVTCMYSQGSSEYMNSLKRI